MNNNLNKMVILGTVREVNLYNILSESYAKHNYNGSIRPEYSIIHPLMDCSYGMDYLIDFTQSPQTIIKTPYGMYSLREFYNQFSPIQHISSPANFYPIGKYCLEENHDNSKFIQLGINKRGFMGNENYLNIYDCLYRYNEKIGNRINSHFYHPLYKRGNHPIIVLQDVLHIDFYFFKHFEKYNISILEGCEIVGSDKKVLYFIQNQKILKITRFQDSFETKDIDMNINGVMFYKNPPSQPKFIKSKTGKLFILGFNDNICRVFPHNIDREIEYNNVPFIDLSPNPIEIRYCKIKFKFNNMILLGISVAKNRNFECLMFGSPNDSFEVYYNRLLSSKEKLSQIKDIKKFPFILNL